MWFMTATLRSAGALWLAALVGAAPTAAMGFEEAVDALAREITTAVTKIVPEAPVLVMEFRSQEGLVECQPLSGMIGDRFLASAGRMGAPGVRFVTADGGRYDFEVRGGWSNRGQGDVDLLARLYEGGRVVASAKRTMKMLLLGRDAEACLFTLRPDDANYIALRELPIRDAPSLSAKQVDVFPKGATVKIELRLHGTPWKVVTLPHPLAVLLPEDARRGFLYAKTDTDIAEVTK